MSMKRRTFLAASAALGFARGKVKFKVAEFDGPRVLHNAQRYLLGKPLTVTAAQSKRSAGGLHDFFSEGDYWWPNPNNPEGAYIQRDGMTNPDNFVDHRKFLMRLSVQAPALVAAWSLTKDTRYAEPAAAHVRAWVVDEATRMNPNLQFAQAMSIYQPNTVFTSASIARSSTGDESSAFQIHRPALGARPTRSRSWTMASP